MNYPTKEAVQQIHASPRTADEERLSSDLLAWREIAENMERYAWHKTDCDMKRNGLDGDCMCGYFAACAAYEKAVQS